MRSGSILSGSIFGTQLALSMDNSETIAQIVAGYVSLRRTPDTMNKLFDQYAALTPKDVQEAAAKYLTENARTIVTLAARGGGEMRAHLSLLAALIAWAAPVSAQMRVMAQPNHSPLVTFRIVFTAAAAADPRVIAGVGVSHGANDRRRRQQGAHLSADRRRDVSHGVRFRRAGR